MTLWTTASWWAGGVMALAALAIIALALFRDRPRGRRRCPRCWYDMSGVSGMTCPECGKSQARETGFRRTRRRWRRALAGLMLIALAGATVLAPAAITGKWAKYTPMPLLRFGLSFFDTEANDMLARVWRQRSLGQLTPYQRLLVARGISNDLRSEGDGERWRTQLWLLTQLGDEVKPALPELAQALKSGDTYMRRAAKNIHSNLAARALPNVPVLRRFLSDPSLPQEVHYIVIAILTDLKARDSRTIRALHTVARTHADPMLRLEAASALVVLEPESEQTVEALICTATEGGDPVYRVVAARQLGWYAHSREGGTIPTPMPDGVASRFGYGRDGSFPVPAPSDRAIAALADMLTDQEITVRLTVANVLAGLDERVRQAQRSLRRAIDAETNEDVRKALIRAYARSPEADVAFLLDELFAALMCDESDVRTWATSVLVSCGQRAGVLLPRLEHALVGANQEREESLCDVLAGIGEAGWAMLEHRVHSGTGESRDIAAKSLGAAARKYRRAAEILHRSALTEADSGVRAAALRGLAGESSAETLGVIRRVLTEDPSPEVRSTALGTLASLADEHTLIDFCSLAVNDVHAGVRLAAVAKLIDLGRRSASARTRLDELVLTAEPDVRTAIQQALRR